MFHIFLFMFWLSLQNVLSNEGLCPDGMFDCQEGCIQQSRVCDGKNDCANGRDEHNCALFSCRPPFGFLCNNKKCVSRPSVCEGNNDCGDWSDEVEGCRTIFTGTSTTPSTGCEKGQFQCHFGFCIPGIWECDGEFDCPDNSDEHSGCNATKVIRYTLGPRNCTSDEWRCHNGFCIPLALVCDDVFHCPDYSDELIETCVDQCQTGFRCDDGSCLALEVRCDGVSQCADHSDERNCNVFPGVANLIAVFMTILTLALLGIVGYTAYYCSGNLRVMFENRQSESSAVYYSPLGIHQV